MLVVVFACGSGVAGCDVAGAVVVVVGVDGVAGVICVVDVAGSSGGGVVDGVRDVCW